MKIEETFPKTIKDYGKDRWGKRFYRNFPVERERKRRYYYDDYNKLSERPKVKQPKPEPKPPKAVIENKFILEELSSGYQNKIYGKFLLSTGEKVMMQIKAPLVVDYINSKSTNNVFVLGPDDQLYLKGSKEYLWHKANSEKISSKHLVPGFVYWCATAKGYHRSQNEKEIRESQKLYLGKIKMTGVSQRKYEMVDLWYDIETNTYSKYQQPKEQLFKFGESEQNMIQRLKAEGERMLVVSSIK